ncbi:MAG: MerR family DNA-binding transcriptional regulator [Labilithrix sp.]|nr:MerR family DNA-binding transcriptional regulator [Labilithrix sp.]
MTVKDAAAFVGVSEATLRRWDRAGKLRARRHPMNDYRLYLKKDLERLNRELERSSLKATG